jgi:glycosyltransferase involved in cell wall biosynthesis
MNDCKVSIALATYNGERYLAELLESLCQQTILPFEVIVADDSSTDNTISIIEQFRSRLPITIYTNTESVGVVENFQRAAANCTGDFVAFCDQDDIWLPDKLARSLELINILDSTIPALVYTDLIVVDENLEELATSYWKHRGLQPAKETFESIIYGNIVTGCTMLVNRRMITEILKMPSSVIMHDFWIACVAYGIGHVTFVNQPTILYRQHSTNVTNNDAVTWRTRWKRLYTLLTNRSHASIFLAIEIDQAQKYMAMYGTMLTSDKQKVLQKLIGFKNSSPIARKLKTFMVKFLHIHS